MRAVESSRMMIFLEKLIDKRDCRWPEDEMPMPFYEKSYIMHKDQQKEEEKKKNEESAFKTPKQQRATVLPLNYEDLYTGKTVSSKQRFNIIALWK